MIQLLSIFFFVWEIFFCFQFLVLCFCIWKIVKIYFFVFREDSRHLWYNRNCSVCIESYCSNYIALLNFQVQRISQRQRSHSRIASRFFRLDFLFPRHYALSEMKNIFFPHFIFYKWLFIGEYIENELILNSTFFFIFRNSWK